jgi:hypothetical protein
MGEAEAGDQEEREGSLHISQAFSCGLRNVPVCLVGTWFSLSQVVVIQLRGKPAPRLASRPIRRASGTNFVRYAG